MALNFTIKQSEDIQYFRPNINRVENFVVRGQGYSKDQIILMSKLLDELNEFNIKVVDYVAVETDAAKGERQMLVITKFLGEIISESYTEPAGHLIDEFLHQELYNNIDPDTLEKLVYKIDELIYNLFRYYASKIRTNDVFIRDANWLYQYMVGPDNEIYHIDTEPNISTETSEISRCIYYLAQYLNEFCSEFGRKHFLKSMFIARRTVDEAMQEYPMDEAMGNIYNLAIFID
jgi:hypothetical protein